MVQKFDPITLEILWRRIISIVDQADASVARTAFSSLLRDAHDYTCTFTDRKGRLLAQGTFCTPGQAGAMTLGVKRWINMLREESYKPGDVFITNDPWLLAGHLNDVCVMSPIFYQDKLAGFTACVFHHSDVGGRVSSDNRDVFEDGLFIPPVKLYDGGILNESVMNMIRWNVRTPEEVAGDIRSQVAANYVCSQKVVEMMAGVGLDSLDDLADQIMDVTEKSMRDAITQIPDGVYSYEGIVEGPGGRADIGIKVVVEVKGSDITVDLDGSSPEVDWGGNVVYNFTYAYVFMAIKSAFNPDIPNNEGCNRPIIVKAPEGTVVNCSFPTAVAARLQVGHFMTEMVYKALATAAPDRIIASSGGTPAWMQVFYGKRHDGNKFYSVLIRGGGMGANYRQDGHSCVIFPANGANTPAEIFESDSPLIMEKRELLPDSGGPGKMRGGLGRVVIFRVPDGQYAPSTPTAIGIQGGRFRYPADGLFHAKPGTKSKFLINDEPKDPGTLNFANPGDVVTFYNPGGGGYGDPLERDPKTVEGDVIDGYVSLEKAKDEYGVVIDPESIKLDLEATQRWRDAMRRAK
ncbi:MAG: hydantoinase B/oxoprolinase family protein [Dehalococcoidia bacterium]